MEWIPVLVKFNFIRYAFAQTLNFSHQGDYQEKIKDQILELIWSFNLK